MSEYFVHVVKLGKPIKHQNADTLEIFNIFGNSDSDGYPCISKIGTWEEGDLAVYCSVDALVPIQHPHFSFLSGKHEKQVNGTTYSLIKASKLRGVFSMGILCAPPFNAQEGDYVADALGIIKYEPAQSFHSKGGSHQDNCMKGFSVKAPSLQVPVYDLEGIRKYGNWLVPDEEVIVTEKLNGMNARFVFSSKNDSFYVGSRTQFKEKNDENDFWKSAVFLGLEGICRKYPDFVFYGELIGGVSDMRYGRTKGNPTVAFFDVYDSINDAYLDFNDFKKIMDNNGLQHAPVLYQGPYVKDKIWPLSETDSVYPGAGHLSEGIVIRPLKDRYNKITKERVYLKLVGQRYLLR